MCDQATRLDYLSAAINDLSNWIRFMDTKVAVVIAADMLILTSLITNIKSTSSLIQNFDCLCIKIVILILITFFVYNTVRVYYVGISTLLARVGKTKGSIDTVEVWKTFTNSKQFERTSWFVVDDDYKIEEYISNFNEKTSENLVQEMAKELYKLNVINRVKMRKANMTLKAFGWSLASVGVIITFVIAEPYLSALTKDTVLQSVVKNITPNVTIIINGSKTSQDIKQYIKGGAE